MDKNSIPKNISGKIRIRIVSKQPESILNMLWKKDIVAAGIKRENMYSFTITIKSEFLEIIEEICSKTNSEYTIIGLSNFLRLTTRVKAHLTLFLGLGASVFIMIFLSLFVWKIDIKGDKHVSPYEIRQTLSDMGIRRGLLKHKIDTDQIEENIVINNKNILWSKVRIQGSTMQVEVIESFKPPVVEIDNSLGDIVASKDGEIVKIYSQSGTAVVNVGDIVKKGDLLIAGYQGKENGTYETPPIGDVIAKTFLEFEEVIELEGVKSVNTTNKIMEYYIEIFGKKLYFKKFKDEYKDFEKINYDGKFLKKNIYYEINKESYSLNPEQVKKDYVDYYTDNVKKNLSESDNIVGVILDDEIIDNKLRLKITFVIEENISYKVKKIEE